MNSFQEVSEEQFRNLTYEDLQRFFPEKENKRLRTKLLALVEELEENEVNIVDEINRVFKLPHAPPSRKSGKSASHVNPKVVAKEIGNAVLQHQRKRVRARRSGSSGVKRKLSKEVPVGAVGSTTSKVTSFCQQPCVKLGLETNKPITKGKVVTIPIIKRNNIIQTGPITMVTKDGVEFIVFPGKTYYVSEYGFHYLINK